MLRSGSSASALDEDTVTRKKKGLESSSVKDDVRVMLFGGALRGDVAPTVQGSI